MSVAPEVWCLHVERLGDGVFGQGILQGVFASLEGAQRAAREEDLRTGAVPEPYQGTNPDNVGKEWLPGDLERSLFRIVTHDGRRYCRSVHPEVIQP